MFAYIYRYREALGRAQRGLDSRFVRLTCRSWFYAVRWLKWGIVPSVQILRLSGLHRPLCLFWLMGEDLWRSTASATAARSTSSWLLKLGVFGLYAAAVTARKHVCFAGSPTCRLSCSQQSDQVWDNFKSDPGT